MFDTEDEDEDLIEICRDETCDLDYVHPSHVFPLRSGGSRWWLETAPDAHRRADPRGLHEAMQRAFMATDWPLAFVDIKYAIRDDYGATSVRSLHRHVRRLINTRFVTALDLGLSYGAYIRSNSRFLRDLDNLREHLMGRHAQFNERRNASRVALAAPLPTSADVATGKLPTQCAHERIQRSRRPRWLAAAEAP